MRKAISYNGKAGLNILHDGIKSIAGGLLFLMLSASPNKDVSAQLDENSTFFGNTIQVSKGSKYKILSFQEYARGDLVDSLQFYCVPGKVYEEMISHPNLKNDFTRTIAGTNINARDRDISSYLKVKQEATKRGLNPDSILFIHKVLYTRITEKGSDLKVLKEMKVPFNVNLETYKKNKENISDGNSISKYTESMSSFYWGNSDELFRNGFDGEVIDEKSVKAPQIPGLNYNPYKSINTREFYTFLDGETQAIANVRCHDTIQGNIYILTIPQFIEKFHKELGISKQVLDYLNGIKNDIESYQEMINGIESGYVDINDIIKLDSKFLCSYEETLGSYRSLNRNFEVYAYDVRDDRTCCLDIPKIGSKQFIKQSQKNVSYLKAIYIQKSLEFLEKSGFPISEYRL